jgi:hypothetical protein
MTKKQHKPIEVKVVDQRAGVRVENQNTVGKGYVNLRNPKKDHGVSIGNRDIGKIMYEKQGKMGAKVNLPNDIKAQVFADARHPKKDFGLALGNDQFSISASNNGPVSGKVDLPGGISAQAFADARHPKKDYGLAIGNDQFSISASNNGPV